MILELPNAILSTRERFIAVSIVLNVTVAVSTQAILTINGVATYGNQGNYGGVCIFGIVPTGATYACTGSGSYSLQHWQEMS